MILGDHAQSHMILWSRDHEVLRQKKNVSPIAQVLWTPNLTRWWRMKWGYLWKTTPHLVRSSFPSHYKKNFVTPFYGWDSTASKPEPLRRDNLLFTTNSLEIPGTHLVDHGAMKGWVDHGASQSMILKSAPLDWESRALTTRHIYFYHNTAPFILHRATIRILVLIRE